MTTLFVVIGALGYLIVGVLGTILLLSLDPKHISWLIHYNPGEVTEGDILAFVTLWPLLIGITVFLFLLKNLSDRIKEVAADLRSRRSPIRPPCFGSNESNRPASRAENDCDTCEYDKTCQETKR